MIFMSLAFLYSTRVFLLTLICATVTYDSDSKYVHVIWRYICGYVYIIVSRAIPTTPLIVLIIIFSYTFITNTCAKFHPNDLTNVIHLLPRFFVETSRVGLPPTLIRGKVC